MPDNHLTDPTDRAESPSARAGAEIAGAEGTGSEGGRLAAVVYGGTSFVAALVFWLVTTFVGSYPAVARYGGAAWVFVLFMIVLMPIVIPRVRNHRRRRRTECADGTCVTD